MTAKDRHCDEIPMNSFRLPAAILSVAILTSIMSNAEAAIDVSIVSHELDGSIRDTAIGPTDEPRIAVGKAGGLTGEPVPDNSGIVFFELPTLALNQTVLDANLRLTLSRADNLSAGENADLYGLGYVTSLPPADHINPSWYFTGSNDTRTGNDLGTNIGGNSILKITDNFATPNTSLGDLNTDNASDAALTNFINSLYTDHGATGGEYLALRVSANQVFGSRYHRYLFDSRDNDVSSGWPELTLTLSDPPAPVPEPTSLLIWSALGTAALAYRRRRRAS